MKTPSTFSPVIATRNSATFDAENCKPLSVQVRWLKNLNSMVKSL